MPNFFDGLRKNFQSDAQAWAEKTGRNAKEYQQLSPRDQKKFKQERFEEVGARERQKRQENLRQKQVRTRVEAARAQGRPEVVSESGRSLRSFFASRLDIITSDQATKEDFRSTLAALFNTRKDTLLHAPKVPVSAPEEVDFAAQDVADAIDLEPEPVAPTDSLEETQNFYAEPLPNVVPGEFRPANREQVGQLVEGVYESLIDDSGRAQYGALSIQKTDHGFLLAKPYQSQAVASRYPSYARGFKLSFRTDRGSQDPTREAKYVQEASEKIVRALQTEARLYHRIDPELLNLDLPETVSAANEPSPANPTPSLEEGLIFTGPLGGKRGEYAQPSDQKPEPYTAERRQEIIARREAAKRREKPLSEEAKSLRYASEAEVLDSLPVLPKLKKKIGRILDEMRGLEGALERVEPGGKKQQEYQTEYANLSSEIQNYMRRVDTIENTGREVYAQAGAAFDRLNKLQSQARPLSLEERYGVESELLPALENLGYELRQHAKSGRYLVLNQSETAAESLGIETNLPNFDTTVINYENRETRRWAEMEKLLAGDVAILEDVASGELAGLDPKEHFALLKRVARIAEALKNYRFERQYGSRLTKEQAKLPPLEKERLKEGFDNENRDILAKRQRVNRLLSTLQNYGFTVTDRQAENDQVSRARRYEVNPDLARFNEIVAAGGIEETPETTPETAESVPENEPEPDLLNIPELSTLDRPGVQEVAAALGEAEQFSDALNPEALQRIQTVIDETLKPFAAQGRLTHLIYKPDRGFVPVEAERYAAADTLKINVPRSGIVNKNAAQAVATILGKIPLGNASTRESGTTHEQFRHQVFTDAAGEFRVERTPERLAAREAETLAPGVVPENAFSFVELNPSDFAQSTVEEPFSFVELTTPPTDTRSSLEELEIVNEQKSPSEIPAAPETEDESVDSEQRAAAFDSALEGLREIGIPSTLEEAQEFQHHLEDTVLPYTTARSETSARFLPLSDSYEDTVLEIPLNHLTSREAVEVAKTALNLLRPDQTPGSPEYFVVEGEAGEYGLEVKQIAPTRLEPAEEWFLKDEEEDFANPFDLEELAAQDASADMNPENDPDNPFYLG